MLSLRVGCPLKSKMNRKKCSRREEEEGYKVKDPRNMHI